MLGARKSTVLGAAAMFAVARFACSFGSVRKARTATRTNPAPISRRRRFWLFVFFCSMLKIRGISVLENLRGEGSLPAASAHLQGLRSPAQHHDKDGWFYWSYRRPRGNVHSLPCAARFSGTILRSTHHQCNRKEIPIVFYS